MVGVTQVIFLSKLAHFFTRIPGTTLLNCVNPLGPYLINLIIKFGIFPFISVILYHIKKFHESLRRLSNCHLLSNSITIAR